MRSAPKTLWEKAKCRDPASAAAFEDFYPERDVQKYTPAAERAKAVCRGEDGHPVCPVLLECLAFALLTDDGFGIWGGLSPRERNALRRSGNLAKYRAAAKLPPNPYREMIQEYLNGLSGTPETLDENSETGQREGTSRLGDRLGTGD